VIDMPRMPKIINHKFHNDTGRTVITYQERTRYGLFMGKAQKRTGTYYKNMIKDKIYILRKK